jgi:3'-phosphoadenosine 5'-phosphosulfate sulfotransferase
MEKIIHPIRYRLIERKITPERSYWHFRNGKTFYNPLNLPDGDIEFMFGTTKKKVVIELFKINGGKAGYYLADLRSKKYYYCGQDWDSIKVQLRSLGIGREDPTEFR